MESELLAKLRALENGSKQILSSINELKFALDDLTNLASNMSNVSERMNRAFTLYKEILANIKKDE
jgi:hypothetical protein